MSTEEGEKETSVEAKGVGEQEGNPPPLEMGNEQGKGHSSSLSSVVEAEELSTPGVGAENPQPDASKTEQPSDSRDDHRDDHQEAEESAKEVGASVPSESPPSGERSCDNEERTSSAVTEGLKRKGDAEEAVLSSPGVEDPPASGNKIEAGDGLAGENIAVENPETASKEKTEATAGISSARERTNTASILDCTVARVENWASASDSPKHEKKKEELIGTPEKEKADSKEDGSEGGLEAALDEDENKNSPAYIPKLGNFYMHDVRGSEEQDDESKEANRGRSRADRDKWRHDLFDERRQAPKRGDELVKRYGTNIRGDSAKKGDETSEREIDFPLKRSGNLGRTKAAPVSRVRGKGRPHAAGKTVERVPGRRREESSTADDESESSEEPAPPRASESRRRRAEGPAKGRNERVVQATSSSAKVKNGDNGDDVEENVAPRRSIHSRITRIYKGGRDDGGGRDREVDSRPAYSPERNQGGAGGSGRRRGGPKRAPPTAVSRNNERRGGGGGGRGDYETPPYSGASYESRGGVGVRGSRGREDFYPVDRGQRRMDPNDEDSPPVEYRSGGKRYTSQRGNYHYPLPPQRAPSDRGGRYREPADDYYESSSTNNNRRSHGQREQGARYPPPASTNYQQSPQQRRPTQRGGRTSPPAYQSSTSRGYEDNRRPQYSSRQPASYGQERYGSARQQYPAQQQPPPQYSQHQYHPQRTGINTTTSRQQTHSYQQPAGGPSNSSYQLAFPPLGAVAPSQSSHQHHHSHGQQMMKSTSQQHHPPRHQGQQQQNYQHPRQPTDAVYFDAQQQPLNPPPAREKRRLQIIPPS